MAMIRRIQALNYGCLRHVDLALGQFHVLVGPNGSGKSTLFDVVSFLGDMVREGIEVAVEKRTDNFQDLVWGRPSKRPAFELAVEFEIPEDLKQRLPQDKDFEIFRYEVRIGELESSVTINTERALLMPKHDTEPRQPSLFPLPMPPVKTILIGAFSPLDYRAPVTPRELRRCKSSSSSGSVVPCKATVAVLGRSSASPAKGRTTSALRFRRNPERDGLSAFHSDRIDQHLVTCRSLQRSSRWLPVSSACCKLR